MLNKVITTMALTLFAGSLWAAGPGQGAGSGPGSGPGAQQRSGSQPMVQQQQQTQMQQANRFQMIDTDNNGLISQEEAQNHHRLTQTWRQYDTNKDDQIDHAEFSAFDQENPQQGQGQGQGQGQPQ